MQPQYFPNKSPSIQAEKLRQIRTIRQLLSVPLHPTEYCARWVPILHNIQPQDWGYTAACVRELCQITGRKERMIYRWVETDFKSCPESVQLMLRQQDLLLQIIYHGRIVQTVTQPKPE